MRVSSTRILKLIPAFLSFLTDRLAIDSDLACESVRNVFFADLSYLDTDVVLYNVTSPPLPRGGVAKGIGRGLGVSDPLSFRAPMFSE